MGFLDNVTSAVNRGTAAAGRSAEKVKLKAQIGEVTKRRQGLVAQLGASLYEVTRNDPGFVAGREALYQGIAACDAEREQCQKVIDEIDAQAQAVSTAAETFACAVCGARMTGADLFCSGCGTPAAQARPAGMGVATPPVGGPTCAACGAPLNSGDVFCMTCGAKVTQEAVAEVPVTDGALGAAAVSPAEVSTSSEAQTGGN